MSTDLGGGGEFYGKVACTLGHPSCLCTVGTACHGSPFWFEGRQSAFDLEIGDADEPLWPRLK